MTWSTFIPILAPVIGISLGLLAQRWSEWSTAKAVYGPAYTRDELVHLLGRNLGRYDTTSNSEDCLYVSALNDKDKTYMKMPVFVRRNARFVKWYSFEMGKLSAHKRVPLRSPFNAILDAQLEDAKNKDT